MKRSKAWAMKLHWLRDKHNEEYFDVFWDKGSNNYSDYFTKHHATIHHHIMRKYYVNDSLEYFEKNQCYISKIMRTAQN